MRDHHEDVLIGGNSSVLTTLRGLLPDRPLGLDEAVAITEMQANRLLQLQGAHDAPVPTTVVSDLPHISVVADHELARHAASGTSQWSRTVQAWLISVNPAEPLTRQRFTVMHEYWHILMHYHPGLRGPLPRLVFGLDPAEYLAEYFAGCVLMPKRWLKAAYYSGTQQISDLAGLFDVSPRAMEVRLSQLGICSVPARQVRGQQYRAQSGGRPRPQGGGQYSPYFRRATLPALQEAA